MQLKKEFSPFQNENPKNLPEFLTTEMNENASKSIEFFRKYYSLAIYDLDKLNLITFKNPSPEKHKIISDLISNLKEVASFFDSFYSSAAYVID